MIHATEDGVLWVAGRGGLKKFHPESGDLMAYAREHGLASDVVYGILEDIEGNLWLSTGAGISRFDPSTETFQNFTSASGLQKTDFVRGSAYQSSDGQMFFGGRGGLNVFYPEEIRKNHVIPPVILTDFKLDNQSVALGDDSLLRQVIDATDALILSYEDKVFAFEFVALNYVSPQENQYAYKMDGFDEDWTYVDSLSREAKYTNLDAGDYTFRVKASNNDGIWNEEGAAIKIAITPPWWETTWFRLSIGVLVVALLVGGYGWRVRSLQARSRELENQVAERTQDLQVATENADQANQAKGIFLANMSHELRTPINAILGFTRLMTRDESLSTQQHEQLRIINRSGEHLLDMIGDILTLSQIEAGRVGLSEETFDFRQTLGDIERIFRSRAEGKGLRFSFEMDDELPPYLLGDAGKMRQVLINLLDNAFKYTQEGMVCLRAQATEAASDRVMLQFEVEDSGAGIPPEKLDESFETFVRVGQADRTQAGVGLGLSIVKSLVDMMGGEINVASEEGQGTQFKVIIPMLLADEEVVQPDEPPLSEVIGLMPGQPDWRILVVDDNRENLLLLTSLLAQVGFSLQDAGNGAEAVEKFQEWRPHFIWMDVRMPVMDGYEATKQIRSLPGGEEVKIVVVTASVIDEAQQVTQATTGVDDVVLKPFQNQEIFDVMARELGVEYVYQDRPAEPALPAEMELSAEMLAELPPELLQELDETTAIADQDATRAVIERIETHAPETAASLRVLVENFQMGRIRETFRQPETEDDI